MPTQTEPERARPDASARFNIAEYLAQISQTQGYAPRLAYQTLTRSLRYDELWENVARAAAYFADAKGLGVAAGDRVLVLASDQIALVVAYLGVIWAGGVAVAINPRLPPSDITNILQDAAPKLVIIADKLTAPLPRGFAGSVTLLAEAEAQWQKYTAIPPAATRPSDPAFWVYTSGTTGGPKAAIHAQADMIMAADYLRDQLQVQSETPDKILISSRLFFAYALGIGVFGALQLGQSVLLYEAFPDAENFMDFITQMSPSLVFSVPSFYRKMTAFAASQQAGLAPCRAFVSAGERLPAGINQAWREICGRPILDSYGTSETVMMIFANGLDDAAYRAETCGRACRQVEFLLSDEQGRPITAPDQIGSLSLSMPSLFSHYWQGSAHRPQDSGQKWFDTGDLFSCDRDGFWTHHGRSDDRFKIAGQWVMPPQVEAVALAVAGVAEACLVGKARPDGLLEGVLYLAVAAGYDFADLAPKLTASLAAELMPHQVPRRILVVDELPRTPTGKVKRHILRLGLAG